MKKKRAEVRLSARLLWQACLKAFSQGVSLEWQVDCHVVLTSETKLPIDKVLEKLGKRVKTKRQGKAVWLLLPDIAMLYAAAIRGAGLLPRLQADWLLTVLPPEFKDDSRMAPEELEPILNIAIERLPREEVGSSDLKLSEIIALMSLLWRITRLELHRRNLVYSRLKCRALGTDALQKDLENIERTLPVYVASRRALHRNKFWMPSTFSGSFLPPGEWPRSEDTESVVLSTKVVSDSDDRVDPSKLEIYTELGCCKIVEPRIGSSFESRHYIAFILLARSGARIAVLDTAAKNNAAYLFRVDQEEKSWLEAATRSKGELIFGTCAPQSFLGRIIHSEGWQGRLRQALEML